VMTAVSMDADELDMVRRGMLEAGVMSAEEDEEDMIKRHAALNGRRRAM
jgi:hypothetical protein